jgi:hypothetical protein
VLQAKIYLVLLAACMILLVPNVFFLNKMAIYFVIMLVGSTIVSVAVCVAASQVSRRFTDLILPMNVLLRGLIIALVGPRLFSGQKCWSRQT